MPRDENHDFQADRPATDGGEATFDPLESAIAFIRGNAGTTREEPFERRQRKAFLQLEALLEWARTHAFFLKEELWDEKAVIGGSEHDVWEFRGEMWKITRANHFGWTVLPGDNGLPEVSEATPLEYLVRWQITNNILGDTIRLRGIHSDERGTRVIISQPFVAGPYPTREQAKGLMDAIGFVLVPSFSVGAQDESSFFNPEFNIALFDAANDNSILSDDTPVPVDIIPVVVGAKLRQQLLRLIGKY